jgi:DNA-binding response OmpR family regulator
MMSKQAMPTTILIIEDDDLLRSTLMDRLTLEGYRVFAAINGEDGVRMAQLRLPDLILCDITMPGLDGYGVLRALQADPRTAAVSFIFLTAKAAPIQVRVGMGVGADDYLCKPVTKEELLVAIRARLWKQQQRQERLLQATESARLGVVRKLPQELLTPLTGLLSVGQFLENTQTVKSVAEVRQLGQVLHTAASCSPSWKWPTADRRHRSPCAAPSTSRPRPGSAPWPSTWPGNTPARAI